MLIVSKRAPGVRVAKRFPANHPIWSAYPLAGDEIALVRERTTFTAGGAFCVAMLVLNVVVAIVGMAAAANVLQQITAGVVFIGGNVLWGVGVICGRRSVYVAHRVPDRPNETEM